MAQTEQILTPINGTNFWQESSSGLQRERIKTVWVGPEDRWLSNTTLQRCTRTLNGPGGKMAVAWPAPCPIAEENGTWLALGEWGSSWWGGGSRYNEMKERTAPYNQRWLFFFSLHQRVLYFCRFSPAGAHWDNIFLQMSTNNVTDNATKQAADYLPVFREPAKIAPTANNNEETRMDHVSITLQSYLIRKMPALYYIIVFQESHTARGRNVATEQNTPGLNCISC